ncbi:hypothetical protein A5694_16425 [Mycolicibacter sinensis]|nr:hypothetical protein A5694_16425 [Mycolicibacter sinensis]
MRIIEIFGGHARALQIGNRQVHLIAGSEINIWKRCVKIVRDNQARQAEPARTSIAELFHASRGGAVLIERNDGGHIDLWR